MGRKWTKEQKEAARERAKKSAAAPKSDGTSHFEIASLTGVAPDDVKSLKSTIADLQEKLALATAKRSDEEIALLASMQGIANLAGERSREVVTGRTVKVKRASGYKVAGYKDDGREILRPIWKTVELPVFLYRIDLPPCGGSDLKINGVPLYHNATVELDIDTLRTVKDLVYRCWNHDKEIHGSDENVYRKPNRDFNPLNKISARMHG